MTDIIKTSRRALLAGVPAVAALAAGTTVHGLAAGLATPSSSDPIVTATDRHRVALEQYDAAHAHFEAMDDLYPREAEPDEWIDWSHEQRLAWRDAAIARAKTPPRNTAYERWNDQCEKLNEATEALIATIPTTAAGIAVALEHWSEFSARIGDDSDFDFLEQDCVSRVLANIAAALRNIVERGRA